MSTLSQDSELPQKRVHVFLRENRHLEGSVHIPEGQSLIPFLAVKKHFLNLTEARWTEGVMGEGALPHVALRLDQIIWCAPVDQSIPLASSQTPESSPRPVELHLEGNLNIRVELHIAPELRMTDYFESAGTWIPLKDARSPSFGDSIPALAVNSAAVLAIREL